MLCYGITMLLFETPICYGMKFKCYAMLYVVKKIYQNRLDIDKKNTPKSKLAFPGDIYTSINESIKVLGKRQNKEKYLPESVSSAFCVSKQSIFFLGEKRGPEMSPYDVFSSELVAWMTFGSLYDLLLVSVLDRK